MKYAILSDGNHEYDIIVIETENSKSYEMRYSNGEQWRDHTKGEHILSATDDGNRITFTEKFKKRLEYDKFIELKIFLDFIHNQDKDPQVYETYQKINQ